MARAAEEDGVDTREAPAGSAWTAVGAWEDWVDAASEPAAGEDARIGAVLLGRLRVDALIGRGGMGSVYRVTHLATQHARALKLLADASGGHAAETVSRFMREASVSGLVSDPAIVQALDAGVLDDGTPYVLMELLDGEGLDARLERGAVSLGWLAARLARVCEALARAHEAGIVHRDLKPANLFVARDASGEESLRVLDFGIARFATPLDGAGALTTRRTLLGTPSYMAPEQLGCGGEVDGRADVYAMGVVVYEALSGARPYDAASFAELVLRVSEGRYEPLDRRCPGLDDEVYELVERAMARTPDERPSMRELGEQLARLATPERAERATARAVVEASLAPTLRASVATSPPTEREPPRARSALVPLAAAGALLLVLALLALWASGLQQRAPMQVAETDAPHARSPEPEPEPDSAPEPVPMPDSEPVPVPDSAPEPAHRLAPPTPHRAPPQRSAVREGLDLDPYGAP